MKTKNNYILILVGVSAVANMVFIGFLYYAFQSIQDVSSKVVELEKKSIDKIARKERIQSIEENVRELQPLQVEVEQYFVKEENSIDFVEYVESLAEVAEVDSNITIREEEEGLRLSVVFQGEFDNGMHYIALLESIPYNTSIQTAHIEEVSNGLWRGGLTIMMPGSGE